MDQPPMQFPMPPGHKPARPKKKKKPPVGRNNVEPMKFPRQPGAPQPGMDDPDDDGGP